jgi:predicted PhzF superfamily epimerase YddE/YHI9
MSTHVDVVRVFTNARGALGNELGIVRSDAATEGREQAIAAQLGFSETVFVDAVEHGRARIRIFTPASELPFAGHPSVGVAWWLRANGEDVRMLEEKAGDVAVRVEDALTWVTGRADWAPEFEMRELDSAEAVDALDPAAYTSGHHYLWARTGDGELRARMFAPDMGIVEDQATGAAAVRITALLGEDLTIVQGDGCVLRTRVLADGFVEVGGSTVADRSLSV